MVMERDECCEGWWELTEGRGSRMKWVVGEKLEEWKYE